MNIKNILAKEGLLNKRAEIVQHDPEGALQACNILAEKAGIPSSFTDLRRPIELPVPPHMKSLFETLKFEVQWARTGLFATVGWRYTHPDGGSNGLTVGRVMWDLKENTWGWQLEKGREYGYVRPV